MGRHAQGGGWGEPHQGTLAPPPACLGAQGKSPASLVSAPTPIRQVVGILWICGSLSGEWVLSGNTQTNPFHSNCLHLF